MKKLTLEIPLDEALLFLANSRGIKAYLEDRCEKDSDYLWGTATMEAMDDKIYKSIIDQCSPMEIEEATKKK